MAIRSSRKPARRTVSKSARPAKSRKSAVAKSSSRKSSARPVAAATRRKRSGVAGLFGRLSAR